MPMALKSGLLYYSPHVQLEFLSCRMKNILPTPAMQNYKCGISALYSNVNEGYRMCQELMSGEAFAAHKLLDVPSAAHCMSTDQIKLFILLVAD